MMFARKMLIGIAASMLALVARAELITYQMQWTPVSVSVTPAQASVSGFVTVDASKLPVVSLDFPDWANFSLPSQAVSHLEIEVTGTFVQNATYRVDDFDSFVFWTYPGLDLHRELIGQNLGNGVVFGPSALGGTDGYSGDVGLSVDGLPTRVPSTYWYFTLSVPSPVPDPSGGSCCGFILTSMAPVSELAPAHGLLVGVCLLAAYIRRRRSVEAP